LRVSSFADCNGRLYAAVGQQIYERLDGASADWRLVYTNPDPGQSETGLRGLTAISDPAGNGEVLLAAVEGTAARILRVDPRNGSATTEIDLPDFLSRRWGMSASYVIAAYNDMASVPDPGGAEALLIGIEMPRVSARRAQDAEPASQRRRLASWKCSAMPMLTLDGRGIEAGNIRPTTPRGRIRRKRRCVYRFE
jgi:hypothetical protein